jgi:hypothetical protein
MSAVKYVGLDVHAARCAICVMDQQGQVFLRAVVATQAETLRAGCRGLTGEVQVVLEESILHGSYKIFGKATPNAPPENGNFKCIA